MSNGIALVTGTTGALGPALVNQLFNRGYTVRSYGLSEPEPDLFDEPVEHFTGDINDEVQLSRALIGVDVVFHLAALLHIENPGPELDSEYYRVNVDGSRVVAEQAAHAGVRRLIYFSSVKVYGIQSDSPVREQYHTRPKTLYARTKLAGEQAIGSVSGLETVVLRLSAVFGPRLKGSWNRLIGAVKRGIFVPIGDLTNCHSLTHVEDVAHAAVLVADHPNVAGKVFNVVGYEAPTLEEILEAIYAPLNRSLPRVRIPETLACSGVVIVDHAYRILGRRSPITPDAILQLTRNEIYSGAALRNLGFTNQLTLKDSWRTTISQMY